MALSISQDQNLALNPFSKRRSRTLGLANAMAGGSTFAPAVQPSDLPGNYSFPELAGYEEGRRRVFGEQAGNAINSFGTGFEKRAADRRTALASSLADLGQQQFARANPFILEDLNSRGLFSSPSSVNQAQTDALKDISIRNQEKLLGIETDDFNTAESLRQSGLSAQIQAEQDALDAGLDLRRGQLEAQRADAQAAEERALADRLAREQRRGGITQSLIGAGGSLLGGAFSGGGGIGGLYGLGKGAAGAGAGSGASSVGGMGAGLGSTLGIGAGLLGGGYGGQALGNAVFKNKRTEKASRKGASAGAGVGTAIGSIYGPLGSALGGALGGVIGSGVGGATTAITGGAPVTLRNLATGGKAATIENIAKAPITIAKNIGKKIFCFDANTPISMADGSIRKICDVGLGDETRGGTVESIRKSFTADGTRYNYKGVYVTGAHAVLENGRWKRVQDATYSIPIDEGGVVYSLATTGHRIHVNGIVFADELETDDYENLTIVESLDRLNAEMVGVR